jgi:hypothetical protein
VFCLFVIPDQIYGRIPFKEQELMLPCMWMISKSPTALGALLSKHEYHRTRTLQQCLNRLQVWADENGFKILYLKNSMACVHFCRKRKLHLDPQLTLNGNPLPVVESTKFLGVIFDKKLNFLAHIYLKLLKVPEGSQPVAHAHLAL